MKGNEFIDETKEEWNDEKISDRDLGQMMSQNRDTLEICIEKEIREEVQRVVNSLSEKYRMVVLLYYSADLSTGEIAEQLHISKGTVTSRLLRAREK